jgi:hypothetical protein|tara:strand:- start:1439 stop:1618 length:180 start_codon:yes stop_codon:yes gene_type:complete
MKEYIDKVGNSIPNTLQLARSKEVINDTYGLILYGYYEETGFKGFFKKIKQGLKAQRNG